MEVKRFLTSLLLIFPFVGFTQEKHLSFEEALARMLKNNYDIELARNEAQRIKLENTTGNAGLLPKADIIAGTSFANNQTRQEFSNGLIVDKSGVASQNRNAGLFVTWTVFDGLKMFATREKLQYQEEQGMLQLMLKIEQQTEELITLYYQAVKQQQLIKGLQAVSDVSEERVKLAAKRKELGSGSDVELLQAQLDQNEQQANLLQQKYLLEEYKTRVLQMMRSQPGEKFRTDTTFSFSPPEKLDLMKQKIEKSNFQLQSAGKNILISQQQIKETQSLQLPQIDITSAYNFNRNQNAAGFALLNRNLGLNAGVTLNWRIFNGFTNRTAVASARMASLYKKLETEKLKNSLFNESYIYYIRYISDREILELEEKNILLAEKSLKITTERLRLGLGNHLELRESQASYEQAVTRMVNAGFNLKLSETRIKKLLGELVKTPME